MMRILLLLAVLIGVIVILWSVWQVNRRLFAVAVIVVMGLAGAAVSGIWKATEQRWSAAEASSVELTITNSRPLEYGIRLSGDIHNKGENSISHLRGRAFLLYCETAENEATEINASQIDAPQENCKTLAEGNFSFRRHVPPNSQYPWSAIVEISEKTAEKGNRWQVEPTEVAVF